MGRVLVERQANREEEEEEEEGVVLTYVGRCLYSVSLLAVANPVLGGRYHALALDSGHHRPDHATPQVWVLAADVLKAAAVLRNAVQVHPGAELHVCAFALELSPHCSSPSFGETFVPEREREREVG